MGASFEEVMQVVTTISTLYMCASPVSGVFRIYQRHDVGNASVLPYATLWVCNHIWMLYGYVTDNVFPLIVTSAVGDVLSVIFLAVYIRWTTERKAVLKTLAIALLCNAAVTVYVVLSKNGGLQQSKETVTLAVGIIAMISSLALYASPLTAIKVVLQTRSSASLPFAMILAGAINNLLWIVYGVLIHDLFVIVPACVNVALGFVQLALYGVYRSPHCEANADIASPKDELSRFSYSVMGQATCLSIASAKEDIEVCSIAIEKSYLQKR